MSEIEGIKDFIEANKESLENMNKEMIARCSQVPLVYLTLDEAKEIIGTYIGTNCEIVKQHGIPELKIKNPNWLIHLLERIEQVEKGHE